MQNENSPAGRYAKKIAAFPIALAALFVLGLAVMAGLYLEQNSIIREVRFTGHRFTDQATLESSFESPVGLHPDSVRFSDVIDKVTALPWVKRAGVRVEAGRRMILDIEERTPLALLVESAQRYYVDEEGVVVPVVYGKSVNVPLLHGFGSGREKGRIEGEEYSRVRDFLVAARENGFGWITISEVLWDQVDGIVALSHDNGVKIWFGHDAFDEKMRYWQTFYTGVIRDKGIGHLASVDLRYRNQIVTR